MPIRVLPLELSRLIAAGEVVSRPLDAVRELIDNALDAGATRLEVQLAQGGLQWLEVRDNGQGIAADELAYAALRHATSKLESLPDSGMQPADALSNIITLGFRGEALWAAAQAGTLHITSRPATQLGAAQLTAQGSEHHLQKVSAPAGTTVRISQLFAHLPARLRTQLPAATESRDITALVSRYMLHHPHLHWKLTIDGETKLLHAPSDTRGAVASVYGPVTANRTLSVTSDWLSGVISRPELSRVRRDRMFFSVNGRPITPPAELERAVIEAYAELLPQGHAPLCVLDMTLSPSDINPNIHPAKSEIAIAQLHKLCQRITAYLHGQLSALPLARALPPMRVPEAAPNDHAQTAQPQTANSFPRLELIGVFRETYLLAQSEDANLWVIDAHAAHERVLFERLQAQVRALPPYELPLPELLQLNAQQLAHLRERDTQLREWGLVIEEFGAGLARLRSLPTALAQLSIARLHEQIVETALAPHAHLQDTEREVLGRLACAPALKAGMLDAQSGAAVLAELSQCLQPWSCPHGRPTTLRLSERDLAHSFGRRSARDLPSERDRSESKVAASPTLLFAEKNTVLDEEVRL